jgi:hypothetical protein
MYRVTCKQINTWKKARGAHRIPPPHADRLSTHTHKRSNILHAHPYNLLRPEYQRTTPSCPFISPTKALSQPSLHLINPTSQPHSTHQPPCAPGPDTRHLGAPDSSARSVTENIATYNLQTQSNLANRTNNSSSIASTWSVSSIQDSAIQSPPSPLARP